MLTQLGYARRHCRMILRRLSVRKASNLVLNAVEFGLRRERPRSNPPFLKIDVSMLCQLRCPGCVHSEPAFKRTLRKSDVLDVELLARQIGGIERDVIFASLCFVGEPFTNRNALDLVRFLDSRGVGTSVASNLSFNWPAAKIDEIVRSGLDQILVSLDGVTQATYEKYRVGGSVDLVLGNVRRIAERKRELGLDRPALVWKYILFDHNRHELPKALALWRELGFDRIEVNHDYHSAEYADLDARFGDRLREGRKPCHWLWRSMTIDANGRAQSCCTGQLNEIFLGDLHDDDAAAVWRGDAYARLRRSFGRKRFGRDLPQACARCLGLRDRAGTVPERIAAAERRASSR
jgi:MoaA/NifB/PqqE/SkfB family radical SAM enzyme